MDIFETEKLALFIGFVIPGFITLKTFELITSSGKIYDSGHKIIDAISYSCFNYAIWCLPIFYIEKSSAPTIPFLYIPFYVLVLLISPISLAFLWKSIRCSSYIAKDLPHPTPLAWDYVFYQGEIYWVIVNLIGGKKIAGFYGENSFVSSYPESPQIYLEQEWILNAEDGFERQANSTRGVIITTNIESVELFLAS
jgi:hypothetical protein